MSIVHNTQVIETPNPLSGQTLSLSENPFTGFPVFGQITANDAAGIHFAKVIKSFGKIVDSPSLMDGTNPYLWTGQIPDSPKKKSKPGRYWVQQLYGGQYIQIAHNTHKDKIWKFRKGLEECGISILTSHMFEFDKIPFSDQITKIAWLEKETGLRPALIIHSGDVRPESIKAAQAANQVTLGCHPQEGSSLHCTLLLETPLYATKVNLARWKKIQQLLILIMGSDPAIADASHLMRLPSVVGYRYGVNYGDCRIQTALRADPVYYTEEHILSALENLAQKLNLSSTDTQVISMVSTGNKSRKSGRPQVELPADTLIKTSTGELREFSKWKLGENEKVTVFCPHHADKTSSAFLKMSIKGLPFVSCSTCAITFWPKQNLEDMIKWSKNRESFQKTLEENRIQSAEERYLLAILPFLCEIANGPTKKKSTLHEMTPEKIKERVLARLEEAEKLNPVTVAIARATVSLATTLENKFQSFPQELGIRKASYPCGFNQGLGDARTRAYQVYHRYCGHLNCHTCLPVLSSQKAAAIIHSLTPPILDGNDKVVGLSDNKVWEYSVNPRDFSAWKKKFQRASKSENVAVEGVDNKSTPNLDFPIPASATLWVYTSFSQENQEHQKILSNVDFGNGVLVVDVQEKVCENIRWTYQTVDDYIGGVGETGPYKVDPRITGKITSSQNVSLDPDYICRIASKHCWYMEAHHTVSPKAAEGIMGRILANHGVSLNVVKKGDKVQACVTGGMEDETLRRQLVSATMNNKPVQAEEAPREITEEINNAIEKDNTVVSLSDLTPEIYMETAAILEVKYQDWWKTAKLGVKVEAILDYMRGKRK